MAAPDSRAADRPGPGNFAHFSYRAYVQSSQLAPRLVRFICGKRGGILGMACSTWMDVSPDRTKGTQGASMAVLRQLRANDEREPRIRREPARMDPILNMRGER